jgi:hypothetical protein
MMWIIAFAGFVSLGARLACRDWRYIYVAAALLLPMLPYVLGEPIIRYRFPVGGCWFSSLRTSFGVRRSSR